MEVPAPSMFDAAASTPIHSPAPVSSNSASQDIALVTANTITSTSKSLHHCPLCTRVYERADHLNRHLKTHENARPYKCRQCSKRFNRADLLSRHESGHARAALTHSRRGDESGSATVSERVLVACLACVASKCKCQDQKPCARCRKRGISCEVGGGGSSASTSQGRTRRGTGQYTSNDNNTHQSRSTPSLTQDDVDGRYSDQDQEEAGGLAGNLDTFLNDGSSTQMHLNQQQQLHGGVQPRISTYVPPHGDGLPRSMTNVPQPNNHDAQQYHSLSGDFQFNQDLGLVPRDYYFGQDLDFDIWDMDYPDFELLIAPEAPRVAKQPGDRLSNSPLAANMHAYKPYAAFQKSPWLWHPTQKDHSMNDQTNLNIDTEGIALLASTPETPGASLEQFTSCCIDSNMRDRILHLLFTLRVYHSPIKSFPPLSLLNLIIRVYFARSSFTADHIIHSASFNPQNTLPELLLAIISAGATAISAPPIWKMGLVLQEIVRHTVADLWERNNSQTRHLQALQAWMIGIEIGLWSGVKRKMEIAESVCQPAITMMRRAGAFSMGKAATDFMPAIDDSSDDLEEKWVRFVERESFKRLVLRTFIHDAQASVAFQKPPQMSFSEIELDLPMSRDLWLAESASEWREVYLRKQWVNVPSFIEAMQKPEILQQVANLIDINVCAMVIIAGYWGQIWRLMDSTKLYSSTRAAYRLSLMTEQDELYRDLVAGAMDMSSLCKNEPVVVLFSEFFLMVSHVSPEDVQRFAGKSGADESRKASDTFRKWVHTSNSRIAIWHAGQVLRAAKRLMPTHLKEFYAVAVYFASLTLWIYGIMLEECRSGTMLSKGITESSSDSTSHVILNETETVNVNTFRVMNKGTPGLAIRNEDQVLQFLPITSATRILEFAQWIYRSNFPHAGEALPPLVESLGNLMRDLSSLPGSRVSRMTTEVFE